MRSLNQIMRRLAMTDRFIDAFEKAIVDKCRGKNVLLTLTGGMDSRAILAVLVKNDIAFYAYTQRQASHYRHKNDVRVAKMLGEKYAYCHYISKHKPFSESATCKMFDVVLTGYLMTELLNLGEFYNKSKEEYANLISDCSDEFTKLPSNFYTPMNDSAVLSASNHISLYKMIFSIVQRDIIKEFAPELLKYPHTNFSRKRKLGQFVYKIIIALYKS